MEPPTSPLSSLPAMSSPPAFVEPDISVRQSARSNDEKLELAIKYMRDDLYFSIGDFVKALSTAKGAASGKRRAAFSKAAYEDPAVLKIYMGDIDSVDDRQVCARHRIISHLDVGRVNMRREVKKLCEMSPFRAICIYADLSREDPGLEDKLRSLSRHTMTLSVNHIVDIPRLQLRPIVLSIETKEPNQSLNAAEVQMGVWHSTQWAFLRYAMLSLLHSTSEVSTETDKYEKQADDALSRLAFIPGIIVHGHRWLFVLSTCGEGKKMQLWTEYKLGSTLSVRGIYQVVAGLRLLTSWAETVYLPWFQQNVLTHVKT